PPTRPARPPGWGLGGFARYAGHVPSGRKHTPRCLIVDDHPVVRAGVRAVLEQAFDAVDISEAEAIEQNSEMTNADAPDVLIIDPWRAGVDVAEIVSRLRDQVKAPIVVFTSDGGARLLSEALK